jgi:ClpP class serine protease
MKENKDIDAFIATAQAWEIELNFGISQMNDYLNEIALVSAGVPFSELGIAKRRHAQLPTVIDFNAATIGDSATLKSEADTPQGSVAHLKLSGVMRAEDSISTRGIQSLIGDLQSAYANNNIEGILLEVNSGGGESRAGQMLQAVLQDSPKPVIVWGHLIASAAVRATLPADEIIASGAGAEIGSIGTYVTLQKGFAEAYKSAYTDIYADKSTNKNKDFRQLIEGDTSALRQSINQSNEIFLNEVKAFRELKGDTDRTLSGEVFSASAAKYRGLVDGIGGLQYAMKRLKANIQSRKKNMK